MDLYTGTGELRLDLRLAACMGDISMYRLTGKGVHKEEKCDEGKTNLTRTRRRLRAGRGQGEKEKLGG